MKLAAITTILDFFDYFHKKKIIIFLKKKLKKINTFVDVGAHNGESVPLFSKNFQITNVYSFEPSVLNFKTLIKQASKEIKKGRIVNFKPNNIGLGSEATNVYLNKSIDSASSTINSININSNYYLKKVKFFGNTNKNFFFEKEKIGISTLDLILCNEKLFSIDLIKIDTEGYEYPVLMGGKEILKITKFIIFEHHYDNMIVKTYKFSDLNSYLISKNFKQIFKLKMPFRKTFDYIYENQKILQS
jgi:FkbM family methyltransferase